MKRNKIKAYLRLLGINQSKSNVTELSSLIIKALHSRDFSDLEKFKALETVNIHFEDYISKKEIAIKNAYIITESIKDKVRFFNCKYK